MQNFPSSSMVRSQELPQKSSYLSVSELPLTVNELNSVRTDMYTRTSGLFGSGTLKRTNDAYEGVNKKLVAPFFETPSSQT